MPLRQPDATFIPHQVAMIEAGGFEAQRPIQKKLPGRRLQQVRTSDDFRDPHLRIVDHHGELVSRNIIAAPDQKVAEISPSHELLLSQVLIGESHCLSLKNTKPPVQPCGGGDARGVDAPATVSRVERFVIRLVGSTGRLRQVFS